MMDLERLKKRAAEISLERENRPKTDGGQKKKKISRRRMLIWLAEALVLAFVAEQFLWRPWRLRHRTGPPASRQEELGLPAPLLKGKAVQLPHLTEVSTARLPEVAGLAPGAISAQAAQIDVSIQKNLPVELENSIGMRFRLIPNGTFIMGSPPNEPGRGEGEVQHVREVDLPFYMGKFEVTQAQWEAIMGKDTNPSGFFGNRSPVEEVQWYDCQRFLIALCEKEGVPKWTYRLPSEANWEYACRAGALTAYHFGNSPRRLKKFDYFSQNSGGRTNPCGQLQPNAFGLYDMHGNVWEWCRDVYVNYPGCDLPDPTGGKWRVIRGGNFHVGPEACRSAERARLPPASHGNVLGFRVMRVLPELFDRSGKSQIPVLKDPEKQSEPGQADDAPRPEETSQ